MKPEIAPTDENNGVEGAKGDEKSRTPERANMGVKRKAVELQTPPDEASDDDDMDTKEGDEDEEADFESDDGDEDEEKEDGDGDSKISDFEDGGHEEEQEEEQESRETIESIISQRGQAVASVRRSKRTRTSNPKVNSVSSSSPSPVSTITIPYILLSFRNNNQEVITIQRETKSNHRKYPSYCECRGRSRTTTAATTTTTTTTFNNGTPHASKSRKLDPTASLAFPWTRE